MCKVAVPRLREAREAGRGEPTCVRLQAGCIGLQRQRRTESSTRDDQPSPPGGTMQKSEVERSREYHPPRLPTSIQPGLPWKARRSLCRTPRAYLSGSFSARLPEK